MKRRWLVPLLCAPLLAGPPFKTDDPEPVDLGHLELYVFAAGQRTAGDRSGLGPALEFNYGILPETQFHVVLPLAYDRPEGGPSQRGLGDTEVGFKVRLLTETDTRPQIGVFPLVEIPTGNADRGLGAGHTQVYLPVWIQKRFGSWTTYGGYGWWRNPGERNRNWSFAGWLLQRDFGERLTLGAELVHSTATTQDGEASDAVDLGGQVNFGETHHLLFSLGRTFHGERQTSFYLGYQLTAGTWGNLADWFHRAAHG
ncbi:MAG TPA: transporter [Holophagaceae bacterium]|nr:transporter [Holophagaceae bacterium]